MDYEGKRDRWNGYDPSEHKRIFEEYQRLEEARKIAKAKKLEEKLAKATEGSGGQVSIDFSVDILIIKRVN